MLARSEITMIGGIDTIDLTYYTVADGDWPGKRHAKQTSDAGSDTKSVAERGASVIPAHWSVCSIAAAALSKRGRRIMPIATSSQEVDSRPKLTNGTTSASERPAKTLPW